MSEFEKELKNLLHSCVMEAGSDTPDFILARYLLDCLTAFNNATNKRDEFYREMYTDANEEECSECTECSETISQKDKN